MDQPLKKIYIFLVNVLLTNFIREIDLMCIDIKMTFFYSQVIPYIIHFIVKTTSRTFLEGTLIKIFNDFLKCIKNTKRDSFQNIVFYYRYNIILNFIL